MKKIPKITIDKTYSKSFFSSVLLTLIFSLFVSFFYLMSPSMESIDFTIRTAVVLFYTGLFFLMMRTGRISTYRSVFFVSFAFLFVKRCWQRHDLQAFAFLLCGSDAEHDQARAMMP